MRLNYQAFGGTGVNITIDLLQFEKGGGPSLAAPSCGSVVQGTKLLPLDYRVSAIARLETQFVEVAERLGLMNVSLDETSVYRTLHSDYLDLRSDAFNAISLMLVGNILHCGVGARIPIQKWSANRSASNGICFQQFGMSVPMLTEFVFAKTLLISKSIIGCLSEADISFTADPSVKSSGKWASTIAHAVAREVIDEFEGILHAPRLEVIVRMPDADRISTLADIYSSSSQCPAHFAVLFFDRKTRNVVAYNPKFGIYLPLWSANDKWYKQLLVSASSSGADSTYPRFVPIYRRSFTLEDWADIQRSTDTYLVDINEYLAVTKGWLLTLPCPDTGLSHIVMAQDEPHEGEVQDHSYDDEWSLDVR